MKVPNHLGLIIDGNRRWAKARGLPPWYGHRKGAETLEKCLNWCMELGIPNVSVYVLSKENLEKRPKREIKEILKLLKEYLKKIEKKENSILDKYEVKVRFVGNLENLPRGLLKIMRRIMKKTAKYQKRMLNLLIAYSGKFELTHVLKRIAEKAIKLGRLEIREKDIEANLLVPIPLDLVIRTGGYHRLSNFLIWQASYAETYFTETLWPDFTKKELIKAIKWFNGVRRNFGR